MSCDHAHIDTLESFDQRVDPTGTATLRRRYAQKLRGAFDRLSAEINAGIRDSDVFGLQTDTLEPPNVALQTDDEKIRQFMQWLNTQTDRGVLETIDRDDNPYVRSAYRRGLVDADQSLRDAGIEVGDVDLDEVFNQGVHERTLQRLYTKNYENLKDVNGVMASQIRDELSRGLAEGINPNDMARNITDRVDKIGKTRATVLARTETIDAYSEATLNRYDNFGVTQVEVQAEWLTAGDNRVCPICINLEGNTWSIQEARTGSVRLTEDDVREFVPANRSVDHLIGEFPIRPPAHAQCRCRLVANITN